MNEKVYKYREMLRNAKTISGITKVAKRKWWKISSVDDRIGSLIFCKLKNEFGTHCSQYLLKVSICMSPDVVILLLGVYPENMHSYHHQGYMLE